ncbi:unnamed protein product [Candida verbasci]|uniref:Regulator of phospholipase D SRF1 n=1 Tax=Candida verbasci TaxID=1227364 RepID=A0A9W4TWD0_9ASCO|nr:unnamed protein product [Candida verbasci]
MSSSSSNIFNGGTINLSNSNSSILHDKDESVNEPVNPFKNIQVHTYGHKPNVIPPYVLDNVSKAYTLKNVNNNKRNSNASDDIIPQELFLEQQQDYAKLDVTQIYNGAQHDPYIRSIDGSWFKFKESIRQKPAYTMDKYAIDPNYLNDYDLKEKWNGDERLKNEFIGPDNSNDFDIEPPPFCLRLFGVKERGENDTKIRSTAGYWMGENRSQLKPTLKKIFLFNPLVPLFLRILTLIFCAIALALACSIFVFSKRDYDGHSIEQKPSTIMAIVVQSVALVYVIYIAYDEYSGKPLGLREPMSKMRLVMLDLLFIIFSSANLSLAFNTLYDDEWVCRELKAPSYVGNIFPVVSSICKRQRGLASFLFVVLFTWVLTFTISLLRVIDKVNTPGPGPR